MNNGCFLCFIFTLILCSTAKCEESMESHVAVQVEALYLHDISTSVLMAESWLRSHVLSHYPATNITTIVVGQTDERRLDLILPSIKNIHHSLTRWGLQNHIKLAASFSLDSTSQQHIKPLLTLLQQMGSPYVAAHHLETTLKSHLESMGVKPLMRRKLSFIDISNSKLPFPPTPTPTPHPNPAYAVGSPLPPLIGTISPSLSPKTTPHTATPPHLPPCEPPHHSGGPVGAPAVGGHHGLWCVAKPSVPAETLQEALDYACGEGAAECAAIQVDGNCYYPDTVVAHASYAFNSYWQKTKRDGGTCGFGGTAMLINSDPSYGRCRFVLS